MSAHVISSSVTIARPAEVVATYVLDWGNDAEWRAAVRGFEVEPSGRAVVGQRLVEDLVFAGLSFRTPTTVTEATGLRAAYAGGSGRMSVAGRREVEPVDAATCRVTTRTELTGRGVMRLLAPVLAPTYRTADARDLRALAARLG